MGVLDGKSAIVTGAGHDDRPAQAPPFFVEAPLA